MATGPPSPAEGGGPPLFLIRPRHSPQREGFVRFAPFRVPSMRSAEDTLSTALSGAEEVFSRGRQK